MRLRILAEHNPPPPPQRRAPAREKVFYPFDDIPVGGASRFPRAAGTVRNRLTAWCREHPGQRFKVVPISRTQCRVYRLT